MVQACTHLTSALRVHAVVVNSLVHFVSPERLRVNHLGEAGAPCRRRTATGAARSRRAGIDAPLAHGACSVGKLAPDGLRVFGESALPASASWVDDDFGVERDDGLLLHLAPAARGGRRDGLAARHLDQLRDETSLASPRRCRAACRARGQRRTARGGAAVRACARARSRLSRASRAASFRGRVRRRPSLPPICSMASSASSSERLGTPSVRMPSASSLILDERRLRVGEDDEVGAERCDLLEVRVAPTADARQSRSPPADSRSSLDTATTRSNAPTP